MHWNYGTGVNGDHKSPNNVFRIAFICVSAPRRAHHSNVTSSLGAHDSAPQHDDPGEQDVLNEAYTIESGIASTEGSRPGGWTRIVTVPRPCKMGTYAMIDRKNTYKRKPVVSCTPE